MTPRRARWASVAALTVPIVVLFLPFASGSRHLHGQDFEAWFRPHAVFARESWRQHGEFPRWNPRQYAGVPFLGNALGNLYYPGNWLFLIFSPETAFETLALLHLLLAAFGMYRLTRHFGVSRPAATLAATAYSLSFSFILRINAGHVPFLITQSQAPLLLYLALKAIDRPTPLHSAALAGMIGLVLLGGTPQFLYHLALLGIAIVGWRLVAQRASAKTVGAVVGTAVLGAALAAVSFLPAFEVAEWSNRGGTDRAAFAKLSEPFHDFEPAHLLSFWIPMYPWTPGAEPWLAAEKGVYIGILPLLLALLRISERPIRGAVLFFAVVAAVALLDGIRQPLPSPLSLLPWYSLFRIPERVFWIVVLALSVLSAFGWEAASHAPESRRLRIRRLATLGALPLLGALFAVVLYRAPEAGLVVGLAGASLAALAALPRAGLVPALAIALTALDLVGYGLLRFHPARPGQYEAPPWYARHIGRERSDYRLLDLTRFSAAPVAHGFRLLRALGHPVPSTLSAYYASGWSKSDPRIDMLPETGGTADPAMLRRLNVRWVVTDKGLPAPGWKEVARDGRSTLYEDPSPGGLAQLEGADGMVVARRPTDNSIVVRANLSGPGRLVLSESWTPGWRAERNGTPMAAAAVEGGLIAIDLPEGESLVKLVYAPSIWRVGRIISGLGLITLAGLLVLELRRRRKRAESGEPIRPTGSSR